MIDRAAAAGFANNFRRFQGLKSLRLKADMCSAQADVR